MRKYTYVCIYECIVAFGCPPLVTAPNTRINRQGDHAVVKCNDTDESWYLTCRGRDWIGEAGNCSYMLFVGGIDIIVIPMYV